MEPANALLPEGFAGYAGAVPLARGEHSTVYRAIERATGRAVALKALDVTGVSARELEAFAREIAVLGRLSTHPHIVTLYDSFRTGDGRPVLALELCRGSLAQQLAAGALPSPRDTVAVGIKLAGALETAHRGGVLHRDVRPSNILLTEVGEPVLADFGVARLRSTSAANADLFDFPSEHIAPELLLGVDATEASDVYGLAATLYHLLAGHPPFPAFAGENPAATILRILRDPVRPVAAPGLPVGLNDLLLWALAKEPEQRPPGMAWFAEELMRVETQGRWRHTGTLVREPGDPIVEPAVRPHSGLSRGRRRPRPFRRPDEMYPAHLAAPPAAARPHPDAVTVVRAPWAVAWLGPAAVAAPLWAAFALVVAVTELSPALLVTAVVAGLALTTGLAWLARPRLLVTSCHLEQRGLVRRDALPWAAISGLRPAYEPSHRPGGPHGVLVALEHGLAPDGDTPLRLAATRRRAVELAPLAARIEAHRRPELSCPHRT